jgi:hypothetical protein
MQYPFESLMDGAAAFTLERRWLPDSDGALTNRLAHTNVPRTLTGASACGYEWGTTGPGAHELAVNILEAALREMGHRGPRSAGLDGDCFTLALLLRARFVAAFLAGMHEDGGSISLGTVTEWITLEEHQLASDVREMIAPRYFVEGQTDEHWSARELSEIFGPLTARADGIYSGDRRIAILAEPHPLSAACWETPPI